MSRRKIEMVYELVDRASRPMQRMARLMRSVGRASDDANRRSASGSRRASVAQRGYARAVEASARAQDALHRGIVRSDAALRRQVANLRRSTTLMRTGARNMAGGVGIAAGIAAGYAVTAGAAARALIGPSAQFERFAIQLETLEGSSEKGKEAMRWIEDFATRTPMELHEVVDAYAQMRNFGLDPTNGSLMALLDTMAAAGKGTEMLQSNILALGKAQTTGRLQGESMMMLMERGIPVYDILSEKMGVTVQRIQEMQEAGELGHDAIAMLIDGMGERSAGAAEKLSLTWGGIMSNLMDWWTKFVRMVAGAGPFQTLKDRAAELRDTLNRMYEDGSLQALAERVASQIMIGLRAMDAMVRGSAEAFGQVKAVTDWLAGALGGYRNLALAVIAIPLRGVILGTAMGFVQLARGAGLAMRAIAGIGFASAGGAALRFGTMLVGLLNPLKLVRAAMVALRVAVISTGIGAALVAIAMAGTWIHQNWAGLTRFFAGFGQAFTEALGPAAPMVDGVMQSVRSLARWIGKLTGPVDANGDSWHAWGVSAGAAVGETVRAVADFAARVADWFGGLPSIDWPSLLTTAELRAAWNGLSTTVKNLAPELWAGLKAIVWRDLVRFQGLVDAILAVGAFLTRLGGSLWSDLPSIAWSSLIDLARLQDVWNDVTGWFGEKARALWDLIPEMPDLRWWADDTIDDPGTLLAAAQAAADLERQFPQLQSAAQETQSIVSANIRTIGTAMAGVELSGEGARIARSLATGLLAEKAAVRAAALELGGTIRTAMPANVNVAPAANTNAGLGSAVAGARAMGGPVTRGLTYLVGERGPELFRAPLNGRITDHARTMRAVRGAGARSPDGARYARGAGGGAVSYAPRNTYNITSSDPEGVRREIEALERRAEARILRRLDRMARDETRRAMA